MTRSLVSAFFLIASLAAIADESAIRAADIPKDAPRASDYPASPYTGAQAAPDVTSSPRSRTYRTVLRGWATEKPNFAGHYILATWGCGTGCTQVAIIDAITGKVFHPAGIRTNQIIDVDPDALEEDNPNPRRADFGALRYRVDSRLLVLFGTPENKAENRGISYYVWENEALKRLRLVRK